MDIGHFLSVHLYFLGTLFLSIPFFVLFYLKPKSRQAMLFVGFMCGTTAFIFSDYSVRDYWNPIFVFKSFPFEDFLYGFFFGGFSSECADLFLNHKFIRHKNRLYYLVASMFIFILLTFLFIKILKFNSIVVLLIFALITGLVSLMYNHKILIFQIVSAVIATTLSFLAFQILILIDPNFIANSWKLQNLSGYLFLGIPFEEYLFAFLFGFCITHFFEMVKGLDVKLISKKK